jgi:phosphatidylinositol-4,5-bisphosphate 3-kinase
MTKETKKYVAK